MGDNNIISGTVVENAGGRLVVEDVNGVRASVRAPGDTRTTGDKALVAVRAAAVRIDENGSAGAVNTAECEVVFVEFLGDLVKLHLTAGGERLLVKTPGDHYPSLRGREGERVRIAWEEDDVQLLAS
jgi:ABC-type sugar transport system ATPase subunit